VAQTDHNAIPVERNEDIIDSTIFRDDEQSTLKLEDKLEDASIQGNTAKSSRDFSNT
jgi:hypothetical protein